MENSKEILNRLHGAIAKIMSNEELKRRYLERGIELTASGSPEEFSGYIKSQAAGFATLVREAGIKVE